MSNAIERTAWSFRGVPGLKFSHSKLAGSRLIPPHLHRYDMVTVVLEGRQRLEEQARNRTLSLSTGDVAVLPRGVSLSGRVSGHCLTVAAPAQWGLFRDNKPVGERLQRLARLLDTLEDSQLGGGDLWREAAARLSTVQPRWIEAEVPRMPVDSERALQATRLRLEEDFRSKLALQELAQAVGWHPHHLQKMFRKRFGLSPAHYQSQLRAEKALEMTKAGFPGTEIAHELGFCDQSHLIRVFRRFHGLAPGAFESRLSNLPLELEVKLEACPR